MLLATNNTAINQIAQPASSNKKSETPDASFADIFSGKNAQVQNRAAANNKAETPAFGAAEAQKGQKNVRADASNKAAKKEAPQDALDQDKSEDEKETGSATGNSYLAQLMMMQAQIEPQPDEAGAQPEQDQNQNLNILEGLNVQTGQQQAEQIVAATVSSTGDAEEMARTPEIMIPLEGIEQEAEAAPTPGRANPSPLENVQKQTQTQVNEENAAAQLAKPIDENGQAHGGQNQDTHSDSGQGPQTAIPTFAFNMAPVERFEVPAEPVAPPLPQALAQQAISQTIETIAMGVRNGQQVINIQMKPEFLGRLEMQLLMGSEGLTARIRTSDPAVQATIASQINQMQEELRDKGIQIKDVEVLLSTQQEFMDSQQGAREQFQQGKARYARVGSVEAQITPIVTYGDEMQMENLNGSVDFTA